jgi:hypothetical protein
MDKNLNSLRKFVLSTLAAFVIYVPVGCTNDPDSSEPRAEEKDACTLKVSACNNECHKANALGECPRCCFNNGRLCDTGASYSFYSCQSLD